MSRPSQDRQSARRAAVKRRRALGVSLSVASHAAIVLALLTAAPAPPKVFDPQPVTVELVAPPAPPKPLAPKPRAKPKTKPAKAKAAKPKTRPVKTASATRHAPARAHPRLSLARRAPARRDALPLAASNAAADDDDDAGVDAVLSEGQLAGAASADAGAPGGACDIARALQGALRRDPLVRSAVAAYAGKAIMVWNGDWVRSRGEDGKGLAAVREAILWEVAFAPKACRAEPMHGLVVISLNQAQGTTRLAVGQGEWRWSDLLAPRAAAR